MSSSGQITPKFIKLTQGELPNNRDEIRFNIHKIYMYGEYHKGGSYIMFDGNWDNHWRVNETPNEIDQLIKEMNNDA